MHEGELDRPDVQQLLALHVAAMQAASPPEACHVLPEAGLAEPGITFVTARAGGQLLAIGALKELDSTHGEIKSMRVAPAALGKGAGKAMLDHLLGLARNREYSRVSLETGSTEEFAPALRLYERAGFTPCAPFGGYPSTPFTRFLTLTL